MKKYDIGIFGLWYGRNYGSILTYYALKEVVNGMGYSCVFIRNPLANESLDVSKLVRSHPLRFASEHYEMSEQYSLDKMSNHNEICDRFLLGSDQMWRYELSANYKYSYYFDFVGEDKTKIAYGTSFGSKNYTAPDGYKSGVKKHLLSFDGITVRDLVSQEILKRDYGIEAKTVMDPVFLCPREKFDALTDALTDFKIEEKYILAYILDPDAEIGKALSDIAEKENARILVAFDELGDKEKYRDMLSLSSDKVVGMGDLTVAEWLYLFKNAELVLTNSFHGTCFSIIYEKPFLALINSERGSDRFEFLLGQFGLKERLTYSPRDLSEKYEALSSLPIDFHKAFDTARPHLEFSEKWLSGMLYGNKVCGKNNCVGCGACVSACPKECISLLPDAHGFYRAVIDNERCIKCGICKKTCPVLNDREISNDPTLYEAVSSSEPDIMGSSSGGIFPILARKILSDGGAVVGAAWTDDFTVEHIIVENENDLSKLRKSKYLQSYIGGIFKRVKEILDDGRRVLFTGCPCQCSGLKAYLKKDYKNLIVVDILCANAPSALFFKKYLEDEYGTNLKSYTFRYKDENQSWNCFTTKATLNDGNFVIKKTQAEDNYQRAFHSHMMTPTHCQNCKFQSKNRAGDLTLGDFWGIEKREPELKSRFGVSAMLTNTSKGEKFLKSISKKEFSILKKVPFEWIGGNGFMAGNRNFASVHRDRFFAEILDRPFGEALEIAINPGHSVSAKLPKGASPMQFSARENFFRFEKDIWQEECVNGRPVLKVIKDKPGFGHYASMPLDSALVKGRTYEFFIRFKYKTNSPLINFHVKKSVSRDHKIIYSYNALNKSADFTEIRFDYTADSDGYDEFMIGAAHVVGKGNFISFDSVYIVEKK